MAMYVNEFDYELPENLIAQYPAAQRDASRLMVVNPMQGTIIDEQFKNIAEYFSAGDVLVVNNTRVIPARLLGHKESGGKIEVFLVRKLEREGECWLCLTKSSKGPRVGTKISLETGLSATIVASADGGYREVKFDYSGDFLALIDRIGKMPLPPYINRAPQVDDRQRYQTTFASQPGAVAAPTAGLHFTPEILQRLRDKGVVICELTLHVGLGTFLPVRVEKVADHQMHAEYYSIPEDTALTINTARQSGRRVIALGTTAARTLEYAAALAADGDTYGTGHGAEDGDNGAFIVISGCGLTDIFIYPGYPFKIVDALVTNFHLPQSTLLMLVSALAGKDFMLSAYRQAVSLNYRFFSYGDCMFISNRAPLSALASVPVRAGEESL